MYITIKSVKDEDKIQSKITNKIDALFSGETQPEETPFEWKTPNTFCRTKTFKVAFKRDNLKRSEQIRLDSIRTQMRHMSNVLDNCKSIDYNKMYYEFNIPKRSGGMRKIEAPNEELKEIMYQQLKFLKSLKILNHDAAWAYTPGRDVVGAMKEHTNNHSRWYLKIDLENFFGSINEKFIVDSLVELYPFVDIYPPITVSPISATDHTCINYLQRLARLACRNGVLPQGTPLSPILTNWIMVKYDYEFTKCIDAFKKKHSLPRMIYTRYADDIIISCKDGFNHIELIKYLEAVLKDSPFKFKESKTRYASSAGRNWNLGVMCNKDNKLTVGHKRKGQIKQAINNFMYNHESWCLEDCRSLLGQLSWLQKVEPEYAEGLMKYYVKKWEKNPRTLLISVIKVLSSEI